jgi:hypothetical protein
MLPSADSTQASPGTLSITIERARIHIVSSGFWSAADVDSEFGRLRRLVAVARLQQPCFKVLVDMRGLVVQARDSAERLATVAQSIWTPDDRVALVPRAGLTRMQVDRVMYGDNHRLFENIDRAREWLYGD